MEKQKYVVGNTPKRKRNVKKIILSAAATICVIICLDTAIGNPIVKNIAPWAYIGNAMAKTFGNRALPFESELSAALGLFEGNWRQSVALDMGDPRQDDRGNDNSLLHMILTGKTNLTAARDIHERTATVSASFHTGLDSEIHTDMVIADQRLSVNIPQALDRYIDIDPHAFVTQWNSMILGWVVPVKSYTDADFANVYGAVTDILFFVPQDKTDESAPQVDLGKILEGAKYAYRGKSQNADLYGITLRSAAVNEFLEGLPLVLNEDLRLLIRVSDSVVTGISYEASLAPASDPTDATVISGTIEFTGTEWVTDHIVMNMRIDDNGRTSDMSLGWDFASQSGDNFWLRFESKEADKPAEIALSMEGRLDFSEDRITADMKNVEFCHSADFSVYYILEVSEGIEQDIDLTGSKALGDINLFDAIELIENLSKNEMVNRIIHGAIGDLIGGISKYIKRPLQ